jgi:hypothetical protein
MLHSFCFLCAGGADGTIARGAAPRATPGYGEESKQARKGRPTACKILQIKSMPICRPCRGLSSSCSSILGLRAAPQHSTPGYCSGGACRRENYTALGEGAGAPGR